MLQELDMSLKPHTAQQAQSGFHLLEHLIIVTIIAIISSFAIPAYSSVMESQHRRVTLHSIHHLVSLARSEAIKRNTYVAICPSLDGETCLRSKNYSQGWIIFENTNQDYPVQRDDKEALIDYHKPQNNSHFNLWSNRYGFTFRPTNKRNTNGTFITCPSQKERGNNDKYQSVVISYTGRPRIENKAQAKHHKICPSY